METKVVKVRSYFDAEPAREDRYPSRMSRKRKKNIHPVSVIISALIVILAASLPLMSIWFANQSEVSFIQAFLPASVFMVAGLLFFFVFLLITRRPYFSGVYSAFAIFILADFQIVRGLVSLALKGSAEQYVSGLLGIIILVVVFILLHKFTKEVWLRYAVRIVSITLVGVMALSFIMGNPAFASASQGPDDPLQAADTPTALATPTPTVTLTPTPLPTVSSTPTPSPVVVNGITYANPELESDKLPNVYCFILDEYGPPRTTAKYYGFDNSLFVKFLKDRRFNISSTSLCNIAETTWATGELHRLEPFLTKVSSSRARSYRNKNAELYTSFKSLGYTTYSNSAVPRIFPTTKLNDHMDAFVDLSTLDRTPPVMMEPVQSGGEPVATPTPTITPEPTPYKNIYENLGPDERDWRYSFFTGSTEQDETMYDIAVDMSVLSFFIEKMSDSDNMDDEDTSEPDPIASQEPEPTENISQPSATQSISSPTPDVTPVETADLGGYSEDEEDGEDNVDYGVSAPLDPDYASDPVPFDELAPIPKTLSVHARDMYGVLSNLEQLRTKGFAQPTFLISYFRQPHVPFMFNKYGKPLKSNVKYWWKNPNYYLGQLKFMTTQMMHIIDTILETDPDCVIIIQSDHGIRYRQLVFPLPDGVTKDENDQYYVLNMVYYRGQVLDIEGLSPINTYRTVLTKLGLDMPLVEDPRALEFRGEKYGVPDDDPRLTNVTNNN